MPGRPIRKQVKLFLRRFEYARDPVPPLIINPHRIGLAINIDNGQFCIYQEVFTGFPLHRVIAIQKYHCQGLVCQRNNTEALCPAKSQVQGFAQYYEMLSIQIISEQISYRDQEKRQGGKREGEMTQPL